MADTRGKLIELLAGNATCDSLGIDGCDECPHRYEEDCYTHALATHLIANGVTFVTDNNVGSKWIPVTERLPEKHGSICVCLLKFPEAKQAFPHCLTWHAYGDNGYVNGPHFSDEGLDGLKVTHWMFLPTPPKGE